MELLFANHFHRHPLLPTTPFAGAAQTGDGDTTAGLRAAQTSIDIPVASSNPITSNISTESRFVRAGTSLIRANFLSSLFTRDVDVKNIATASTPAAHDSDIASSSSGNIDTDNTPDETWFIDTSSALLFPTALVEGMRANIFDSLNTISGDIRNIKTMADERSREEANHTRETLMNIMEAIGNLDQKIAEMTKIVRHISSHKPPESSS